MLYCANLPFFVRIEDIFHAYIFLYTILFHFLFYPSMLGPHWRLFFWPFDIVFHHWHWLHMRCRSQACYDAISLLEFNGRLELLFLDCHKWPICSETLDPFYSVEELSWEYFLSRWCCSRGNFKAAKLCMCRRVFFKQTSFSVKTPSLLIWTTVHWRKLLWSDCLAT